LLDEIDKEIRLLTGSDLWRRDRDIKEKQLPTFQSDSSHSLIERKRPRKSPLKQLQGKRKKNIEKLC